MNRPGQDAGRSIGHAGDWLKWGEAGGGYRHAQLGSRHGCSPTARGACAAATRAISISEGNGQMGHTVLSR